MILCRPPSAWFSWDIRSCRALFQYGKIFRGSRPGHDMGLGGFFDRALRIRRRENSGRRVLRLSIDQHSGDHCLRLHRAQRRHGCDNAHRAQKTQPDAYPEWGLYLNGRIGVACLAFNTSFTAWVNAAWSAVYFYDARSASPAENASFEPILKSTASCVGWAGIFLLGRHASANSGSRPSLPRASPESREDWNSWSPSREGPASICSLPNFSAWKNGSRSGPRFSLAAPRWRLLSSYSGL